jgi:glycine/D-amino acid oxidase-like deaminating enzyme
MIVRTSEVIVRSKAADGLFGMPDRQYDIYTDDLKLQPVWLDDVTEPDTGPSDLPREVDVLVIGAGYTGLSAVIETARGGRSTLVIDAERAGWGCSTRNGGQISTSIKPTYEELCRLHGKEQAFRIAREGHEALDWITGFIGSNGIDCDFVQSGRFHAAHNRTKFRKLVESIETQPKGLEVEAEIIERSEQRRLLGTDSYWGGLVYPDHCSLHPAKYHKGLVETARAAGVSIIPFCPAGEIVKEASGFTVKTGKGAVRARDVVVATNGYTGTVTPWQRRRVIPIGSYVIATEELPPELMDRLFPTERVISDTRKVVYYYRTSPDRKRIVFGGRVSAAETDPMVSGVKLRRELVSLFPELAGYRISHSWVGFVAYTFDTLAHTGVEDGIHYAMGYCGSGVSMAGYLGMRTGQKVLGLKEGITGMDGIRFPTRPFYTGNPWFLAPSVAWYRWLDRREI